MKYLPIRLDCCADCGRVRFDTTEHCPHCGQRNTDPVLFVAEAGYERVKLHRSAIWRDLPPHRHREASAGGGELMQYVLSAKELTELAKEVAATVAGLENHSEFNLNGVVNVVLADRGIKANAFEPEDQS